ncbi:hypothetical protein [Pseudoxanthomonas mexicana]
MSSLADTRQTHIYQDLLERYGPLLTGEVLRVSLGYPSQAALRQSLSRNTTPVRTFRIPGRRGRFALTLDVAQWLATRAQTPATGTEELARERCGQSSPSETGA